MAVTYPGAVWMPTRRRSGHILYRRTPRLLVLHTRESPRLGGVYDWPPHLSIDLHTGQSHQHIAFNRSAYALHHSQPNRRGGRPTYQVELVGYARDVPHYDDAWYSALADLLTWFHHNLDVPIAFPLPFAGSDAYGSHGSVRTGTQAQWDGLAGVVGHQHAFDNAHWDPGKLDVARLAHYLDAPHNDPQVAHPPTPHHDITQHNGGTVTLTLALPVLRHQVPNVRGQHVGNLQGLLNAHGAALRIDAAFGPAVEKAVKAFQTSNHLGVDGIVGADTWRHLL